MQFWKICKLLAFQIVYVVISLVRVLTRLHMNTVIIIWVRLHFLFVCKKFFCYCFLLFVKNLVVLIIVYWLFRTFNNLWAPLYLKSYDEYIINVTGCQLLCYNFFSGTLICFEIHHGMYKLAVTVEDYDLITVPLLIRTCLTPLRFLIRSKLKNDNHLDYHFNVKHYNLIGNSSFSLYYDF